MSDVRCQMSDVFAPPTARAEHRTPNAERSTLNAQRSTLNAQRLAKRFPSAPTARNKPAQGKARNERRPGFSSRKDPSPEGATPLLLVRWFRPFRAPSFGGINPGRRFAVPWAGLRQAFGLLTTKCALLQGVLCANSAVRTSDSRSRVWTLGVGRWTLGVGCWVLGVGCSMFSPAQRLLHSISSYSLEPADHPCDRALRHGSPTQFASRPKNQLRTLSNGVTVNPR
jgi:hypothetical protein